MAPVARSDATVKAGGCGGRQDLVAVGVGFGGEEGMGRFGEWSRGFSDGCGFVVLIRVTVPLSSCVCVGLQVEL